jgi:hypothetical protein
MTTMNMRPLIATIALSTFLAGCVSEANLVHTDYVTMEKSSANYAADSVACREIAETRDYFGEAMGLAVAQGVAAGLAGGITGAAIGSINGNAGYGASVGAAAATGAMTVSQISMSGLQSESATTVWAKCMASKGHPVFSVKLH